MFEISDYLNKNVVKIAAEIEEPFNLKDIADKLKIQSDTVKLTLDRLVIHLWLKKINRLPHKFYVRLIKSPEKWQRMIKYLPEIKKARPKVIK